MDVCPAPGTSIHESHLAQSFDACQDRLEAARSERAFSVLKKERVIGCRLMVGTESVRALRNVSPDVVFVGEGDDILEFQVRTAMSSQSRQLTLIDDDKQPHPKVNEHPEFTHSMS